MKDTSKNLALFKDALSRVKFKDIYSYCNWFIGAVSRHVDERDWVSSLETADFCMREAKKDENG